LVSLDAAIGDTDLDAKVMTDYAADFAEIAAPSNV